jgi:hypothetical protein
MTPSDLLEQLLSQWAAQHRLSSEQSAAIRAEVFRSAEAQLESDWLWRLLRPLTALLDETEVFYTTPYLKLG